MATAVIKWFSDSKGYGFATTTSGLDIFVHYTQIQMDGFKTLKPGQKIKVDIYERLDKNGSMGYEGKNIVIL